MMYRNEGGLKCAFKCKLGDNAIVNDMGIVHIGKVIALDDNGFVTIDTGFKEVRVKNDWVYGVLDVMDYSNSPKVCGRCWMKEVPFVPNTNWDNDEHYNNEGHDDWLVGKFIEGELWMNNNKGYVVLRQADGTCLYDLI